MTKKYLPSISQRTKSFPTVAKLLNEFVVVLFTKHGDFRLKFLIRPGYKFRRKHYLLKLCFYISNNRSDEKESDVIIKQKISKQLLIVPVVS